jgi:uncharacterized protein YggE
MNSLQLFFIVISLIFISCSNNASQYIRISNEESIDVPVSFVVIEAGISITGKDAAKLDSTSHEKIVKALYIIQKYGVKEISTSNSSIAADYENKENSISAQSYKIKFYDLTKIDALRAELLSIGFNEFTIASYGSDSLQKYQQELFKKAIINAKVKANVLTEKSGIKIGKICKIVDGNEPNEDNDDNFTRIADAALFAKGGFAQGVEEVLKYATVKSTIIRKSFTISTIITVYFSIIK